MPHQGAWESHTQGEAVQVDGLAGGSARDVRRLNWRKAAAGEPCDAETVTHGSERDGGKRASDGTSPAVYSTSWRRSGHSTQPLRVMPETRGRTAGLWRCPRLYGGGREPQGDKQLRQTTLQVWRAVCAETCKHRFGGGRLETCRKVTRWPSTLLTRGRV